MAKEAGTGWTTLEVDDSGGTARDIKNDVTNQDWQITKGVFDSTGLDKTAVERLLLLADFQVNLTGVFNDAANASHDVLKTVGSTAVARTVTEVISGQTLANECLFNSYNIQRPNTGALPWTATGQLSDGTAPNWT